VASNGTENRFKIAQIPSSGFRCEVSDALIEAGCLRA
jgi:hypothetical protein